MSEQPQPSAHSLPPTGDGDKETFTYTTREVGEWVSIMAARLKGHAPHWHSMAAFMERAALKALAVS